VDSLTKVLPVPVRFMSLEQSINRAVCVSWSWVTVIDCSGDTVTADTATYWGTIDDVCISPKDRKIFVARNQRPLRIIDIDDPVRVETLPQVYCDHGMHLCYVPNFHKVYWFANYSGHPPGNSRVVAIDTETGTITDSLWAGYQVSGTCLDHTGDYVYCSGYEVSLVFVMDARTDSVVDTLPLPYGGFGPPLPNRLTRRIYPSASGNPIQVIRDSMLIGLEDLAPAECSPGISPTVVNRNAPLCTSAPAVLYDASGRGVVVLRQGQNDVSRLAPGVYFVREERAQAWAQAQAVRKIVVAR